MRRLPGPTLGDRGMHKDCRTLGESLVCVIAANVGKDEAAHRDQAEAES